MLAQVADEGDHHQAVEHCHSGQGDEPHAGGDRQWNVPQPQRHYATGQRERNPGEHQQAILEVVEHHEEQREHQQQGHRHHNLQALGCRLQLLELASPSGPVTGRNLHLLLDPGTGLLHERTDIAATHVGTDNHQALAILATDLVWPEHQIQAGNVRQGDEADGVGAAVEQGGYWDQQLRQALDVLAHGVGQTHHHVEAPITFIQDAGLASANRHRNGVLHITDVEPVTRGLVAVDIDGQYRQASGLFDLDLRGAIDGLQGRRNFRRGAVEYVHVVTEDLDRDVATHPGNQLVEAQLDRLRQLIVTARQQRRHPLDIGDQRLAAFVRVGPLLLRLEHHVAVGDVGRHRVGGDLGGAGAGEHTLHFGDLFQQQCFQALLHVH